MADTLKSSRVVHALNLLSWLEGLKSDEILPDFGVQVGNRSFPVHRTVLAACSGYFRAMLSHDTKEAHDGFVVMKGVNEVAVQACIDFMYTGEASFTPENARYIIHAANLMQLDQLTGMASKYLQENMTPENCLFVTNSSEDYWREDVKRAAEEYAAVNIETIIKMEGFTLLRVDDVISFLTPSTANNNAVWNAVMKWVKYDAANRMQHLCDLLDAAAVMTFPLEFILDVVCKEKVLAKSEAAKGLVLACTGADLENLSAVINVKRSLNLMKIMRGFEHSEKAKIEPIVVSFLAKRLGEIGKDSGFLALDEDQILAVFRSPEVMNQPENMKWACIVAWVEHDKERKNIFTQLVRCIRFECLHGKFIKDSILPHKLVREFPECKDIMLEVILDGHCPENKGGFSDEVVSSPSRKGQCTDETERFCVASNVDCNNLEISAVDMATGVCQRIGQFGGINSAAACCLEGSIFILKNGTLFKYHPRFGSWEERAPIRHPVSASPGLVAFRGNIYLVDERMSAYDPKANAWSYGLPNCHLAVGFDLAASEDFIFAVGGRGPSANKARKYRKGVWSDLAPMNQEIEYASAVMWKDLLYVHSRRLENPGRFSVYDPNRGSWSVISSGLSFRSPDVLRFTIMNKDLYVAVAQDNNLTMMKREGDNWRRVEIRSNRWRSNAQLTSLFQVFPFNSAL